MHVQDTKVDIVCDLKVATNPQAAAKRKAQRGVVKKDSRKRKNSMFT